MFRTDCALSEILGGSAGKCIDGEYANYQKCKLLGFHLLMLIISISSRAEEQEMFTEIAKEGTVLMPRTFQQLSQS